MEDREIKELEKSLERIWEVARGFGLDPYPVRFEVVPATVMYEIDSYALRGRYSHWTFGKAYHRMKTMYDFGLSKIYEVVINTNPAYGFLLAVLSIEEHIDPNFFIRREEERQGQGRPKKAEPKVGRYDDLWNIGRRPAEDEGAGEEEERPRGDRLPEKDLVYYTMPHSPSL